MLRSTGSANCTALVASVAADEPNANNVAARTAEAANSGGMQALAAFSAILAAVNAAARVTPFRDRNCCNAFRACASRLDTVPSFQPNSRAASLLLMPSRQHSTKG